MRACAMGILAGVMVLGGCQLFNGKQKEIERRNAMIMQIARDYLQESYPNWLKNQPGTPVVLDDGDTWEYTYQLPEGNGRGAPVVLIDKETMKVVRAYHTQ